MDLRDASASKNWSHWYQVKPSSETAMKCCNFLVGMFRETRAAGNGSPATLSLNWLQISIVMQIRNPRLSFAKFPAKIPQSSPCESPPMIHEPSRGAARGWSLWTSVVRAVSIPGTPLYQENMQFRQAGKAIKCKFPLDVSSAIVPDKFRSLLPSVDKTQLAFPLPFNSLSENQVIRPNLPVTVGMNI